MKPHLVRYERLVNTGDYNHEKFSVELQAEEGDTPSAMLAEAIRIVDAQVVARERERYPFAAVEDDRPDSTNLGGLVIHGRMPSPDDDGTQTAEALYDRERDFAVGEDEEELAKIANGYDEF